MELRFRAASMAAEIPYDSTPLSTMLENASIWKLFLSCVAETPTNSYVFRLVKVYYIFLQYVVHFDY